MINNELTTYLEGLLEAARAGTLLCFTASAVVLPEGSNELDGRSFAALGEKATTLNEDDIRYTANVLTVGMSNAFELFGAELSTHMQAREQTGALAAQAAPKIIL